MRGSDVGIGLGKVKEASHSGSAKKCDSVGGTCRSIGGTKAYHK